MTEAPSRPPTVRQQLVSGLIYVRETGRGRGTVQMLPDNRFEFGFSPWKRTKYFYLSERRVFQSLNLVMSYVTRVMGNPPTARIYWRRPKTQDADRDAGSHEAGLRQSSIS